MVSGRRGMNPLVSIVITHYNYQRYFDECLQSCASQDYSPIEIVVVDDHSADFDTVHAIVEKYKCLCVRNSENRGYAASKNIGILASHGEYIRMLDADDKLTPSAISAAMQIFSTHDNVDLVHGVCLRWYGGNDTRGYNKKTYVHAQGRMYRRRVYSRYGLYYERLRSMADKEFVYRLGVHPLSPLPRLIKDKKIKDVVALYRKHPHAMHRIRKEKKPKLNKEIHKIFNSRIKQLKREGITRENTRFA